MGAKRDREKKVQFWLDPENDTEARALETVNYFMSEYQKTRKQVFLWALEVLRAADWRNDFMPQDTQFSDMERKLNLILDQLQSGVYITPEDRRGAIDEYNATRKHLGEIEQSISSRYRELDFDDD